MLRRCQRFRWGSISFLTWDSLQSRVTMVASDKSVRFMWIWVRGLDPLLSEPER